MKFYAKFLMVLSGKFGPMILLLNSRIVAFATKLLRQKLWKTALYNFCLYFNDDQNRNTFFFLALGWCVRNVCTYCRRLCTRVNMIKLFFLHFLQKKNILYTPHAVCPSSPAAQILILWRCILYSLRIF